MSTVIRSCPGCKSLILSDTDQCPECGHVFYERKGAAAPEVSSPANMKAASILEACPHCGEMVRSGLVRCWSCNGFMRSDVAARYHDLRSNPQKIVYSTIAVEDRTDFLPPRHESNDGARPVVYDADGFSLADDVKEGVSSSTAGGSDFSLQQDTAPRAAAKTDGPDKPQSLTPGGKDSSAAGSAGDASGVSGASRSEKSAGAAGDDDLLSIAMQEEREGRKRRGEKLAERQKKQMLVPCTCGTWVRVLEDQAGRTVRCRNCKQPVQIPEIRRKTEKKEEKAAAPKLSVTWVNDVWFHSVVPTSLVLKPGSLADKHTEADIAITDSGLHVVTYGSDKKKKGGLSFGAAKKPDLNTIRKTVRDQVSATGRLESLPDAEVKSIDAAELKSIRLVQPILKAHESMFAGVPVFGEGRIAVFLPIPSSDGQQTFCSFPLSTWRTTAERLRTLFSIELPASENGVPDTEKVETVSCFINQSRVESIRNVLYYQKDSAFELELSGYRCKACSVVISEEGRKKNKLGGANGKGIAKAKCPKCSQKMGEELLYKIKKAPDGAGQAPAEPA